MARLKQAGTNILAQQYMKQPFVEGVSITDGEVPTYFDAHREAFQGRTMQEVAPEIGCEASSPSCF